MALVERHPERNPRDGHGSPESLVPHATSSKTPVPRATRAEAPESRFAFQRISEHPLGKLALKAGGIAVLMLGLGGIGAFSMKKGLGAPKLALADSGHAAAPSSGWIAAQTALLASVPSDNPPVVASATPEPKPRSSGMTEDGRVILNLAGVEDLRHLPGVGQKRAEAILALRQKLGKFKRPSDLLRVRGIGARRLKQLLPKLVVDPPPPTPAPAPSAGVAPAPSAGVAPAPSAGVAPAPSASAAPAASAEAQK
ncbi:MAG: helix-hairpin-helix domain-containing protein [Polyangiaceae bacterium]